jgi:hypothetical protein
LDQKLSAKIKRQIAGYIDQLNADLGGKFIPADGNVHPVTTQTVHFVQLLVENGKLIRNVYSPTAAVAAAPGTQLTPFQQVGRKISSSGSGAASSDGGQTTILSNIVGM